MSNSDFGYGGAMSVVLVSHGLAIAAIYVRAFRVEQT